MDGNKHIQYYIWGTGEWARRVWDCLGEDAIIGFIDNDTTKIGTLHHGKAIISFEEFLEKKIDDFMIVAVKNYFPIRELLQEHNIKKYFLMADFPGEWLSRRYHPWLKDFVVKDIQQHRRMAVLGYSPYSFCVAEWIEQCTGQKPVMIKFEEEVIDEEFLAKYDLHYEKQKQKINTFDRVYLTVRGICDDAILSSDNVLNIWDCPERIDEHYNRKIERFKDQYVNKRCFIVATGPSLRTSDLEVLLRHKELCFSVNTIYKIFEHTKWRPDFYISDCAEMYEGDCEIPINKMGETNLLLANYEHKGERESEQKVYEIYMHYSCYMESLPRYSEDCSRWVQSGGTITYMCMQFATYMGFREIYLLGVDFTHGAQGEAAEYSHFYKESENEGKSFCYETAVENAYLSAKHYADAHGIKIFNATRGGMLEIFPRVDFDSLFE